MSTETNLNALDQIEANLAREEIDWEPTEAGAQVLGYIGGIEYIDSKHGPIGLVTIDTKDGSRVKVFAGRTRLRKQLARQKVQPGDAIGIRYEGEKESKNGGNSYHDYKVDVVRVGPRRDGEMFTDGDNDLGLVAGATDAADEDDPWQQPLASEQEAGF